MRSFVNGYSTMHKSQAGFDPPPVDDTSYEADALPTKPPWLDFSDGYCSIILVSCIWLINFFNNFFLFFHRSSNGFMRPILGQRPCVAPHPPLANSNPFLSASSVNGFRHEMNGSTNGFRREMNGSSVNGQYQTEHNSAWTSIINHPNAQIW